MAELQSKKYRLRVVLLVCVLLILASSLLSAISAMAEESGIEVSGAKVDIDVEPGIYYRHTITISNYNSYEVHAQVDASGFGQSTSGTYQPLSTSEDISPYSAQSFISYISHRSFNLSPGESKDVYAHIAIPNGVGDGGRYAIIYITFDTPVSIQSNLIVPIFLTIKDSTLSQRGTINDVTIGDITSGEPIPVTTDFANTGNYHYRLRHKICIKDSDDNIVGTTTSQLTSHPLLPTHNYQFDANVILSDPTEPLSPGIYSIESKVIMEDGTTLDTHTTALQIEDPYEQFPGIDPETLITTPITYDPDTDPEPPVIDARDNADVRVVLKDTGKVEDGKVIVAKYMEEPLTTIPFSSSQEEGGAGGTPIKFVEVHINGFNEGAADITVYYTDDEIGELDEHNLFLAFWNGDSWQRLDNLEVFSEANYITGEIPVSSLTGTIIGLGSVVPSSTGFNFWLIILFATFGSVLVITGVTYGVLRIKRSKGGERDRRVKAIKSPNKI